MKIISNYPETVTYALYNTGDSVNAIAIHDGTLGTRDSSSWNAPSDTKQVKIIFKCGLRQVASRNVSTGDTTTLNSDGSISV